MNIVKTTLISEELLKTYSPIPLEFEVAKMIPFILSAQSDIRKQIGDDLYFDLVEQIDNGTLTNENKALIIEMAPVLANLSIYYALPSLWLSITQKGVTKEQSENSTSAQKNELTYLRMDIKTQSDKQMVELLDYLDRCANNYPLYKKSCVRQSAGDFIYIRKKNQSSNINCGCGKGKGQ